MISDRSAQELANILDELIAEQGRNHKGVQLDEDCHAVDDPRYFETMHYDPELGWVYDYSCLVGGVFTKILEKDQLDDIFEKHNFEGFGAVDHYLPQRFQSELFKALFLDLQSSNDEGNSWGEIVDEAKYKLSQIESEEASASV